MCGDLVKKYVQGKMTDEEMMLAEAGMCRSDGHCAVMGTASTMACMVESLGLSLPDNAAIPAPDATRKVIGAVIRNRDCEYGKEESAIIGYSYP